MRWRVVLSVVVLVLCGCTGTRTTAQARTAIVRANPWAGKGVWLRADTHVHTTFSDGSSSVEELVTKAEQNGLDVIAITDHLDRNLKGATPEYFAAIDNARKAHPRIVVLAGAEWNLPPSGGDDHAVILVPAAAERTLTEFKTLFDDLDPDGKPSPTLRPLHDPRLASDGLRWLQQHATYDGVSPVVVYEHPSRRNAHSVEAADIVKGWRAVNELVIGFAGAPGHQGKAPIGGYTYKETALDRWDPAAARVGDAWDTLLKDGFDVWAAYAPSDFHNAAPTDLNDFWPGQFSSTWLYAPERTQNGVLRALRAGSFFADHGRFVQRAEIAVSTPGLPREALAGEAVRVPVGTPLRLTVRVEPVSPNQAIDSLEIIGVSREGARVLRSDRPTDGTLSYSGPTPEGGIVFRARGYHVSPDGSRLAFYTNPVRVVTK